MTTLKTAVLQTIAFMAFDFLTKESIILGYRSSVSEDSLISGKTVLQKRQSYLLPAAVIIPSLDGKQYS